MTVTNVPVFVGRVSSIVCGVMKGSKTGARFLSMFTVSVAVAVKALGLIPESAARTSTC